MAKFTVAFVQRQTRNREDEVVQADHFEDNPPFVDFIMTFDANRGAETVARYRQDDILRILRGD